MSTRSLEEGSGADIDAYLVQRHPTQRRTINTTTTTTAARPPNTRSHTDTLPPHTTAGGSNPSHTPLLPPSSSSRLSLLSSPYFALVVTLLLFLIVLSASSYLFLRLQQQHPDHLFTPATSTTALVSPLLSQHPAYQQLQRELTGQYQQMLTLAKRYMADDQWREFQAEAVRIDSAAAVRELQQQQQPKAVVEAVSCPACPVCSDRVDVVTSDGASSRLSELTGQRIMTDWSVNSTAPLSAADLYLTVDYDWRTLEHDWHYCPSQPITTLPHLPPYKLCDSLDFRREQWYQKQQFVIPTTPGVPIEKPRAPQCIWPPPADYVWPAKHASLPATANSTWIHWPNHYVMNDYNLSMFNYGYGKNLYHFNAPHYDREQLAKLDRVAAVVPFGTKIRTALDVGAGGGSLSLLLLRRYNIVTLNLVYAELPYCEYITERGGLCAHITAFYSMPFAKFSYDLIHIAWLFHMFNGANLIDKLMEVNRVLRPGGYLWWEGGFSYRQRDDVKGWAAGLGYVVVWEESVDSYDKTMFGSEPHQCDYTAVFRKPSRGVIRCDETSSKTVTGDVAADHASGR